jgi:hypothetical protein
MTAGSELVDELPADAVPVAAMSAAAQAIAMAAMAIRILFLMGLLRPRGHAGRCVHV